MKVCSKCKVEKDEVEFHKETNSKDGLVSWCKSCVSIYGKIYRKPHAEENKQYQKEYRNINKNSNKIIPKLKVCSKCRIEKNSNEFHKDITTKDGLRSCCKDCYNKRCEKDPNHKHKCCERNKRYKQKPENKAKINIQIKNRRKNDPDFKIRKNFSRAINAALSNNNLSKNGKSCFDIVSYSFDGLIQHLENKFEYWMTKKNHGVYNSKTWDDNDPSTWVWNIDHIIPLSHFDLTDPEQFQKAWALENLRPYSAKQNVLDGNRRKINN